MQIQATIKKVGPVQTVGSNGFKKSEVWVVENSNPDYPQTLSIEFTKDNAESIQEANEGDTITMSISLRGRLWTNPEGLEKCFNSINCYKYELQSSF